MAVNPLSPGVYIEEIPLLPGSIAGVATAIPAFIGYVEKAERNGLGIPLGTPTRITSLLEYETIFGKAVGQIFSVAVNDNTNVTPTQRTITVIKNSESLFKLYYNMQMYFANGGGPCWIVPVGLYTSAGAPNKTDMLNGIGEVAKVDEPTLLTFPDAVSIAQSASKDVYDAALAQCELLKDRFVIMDVLQTTGVPFDDAADFRNDGVGSDNLKYGASYYPNLSTTLNFATNSNALHINDYTINSLAMDTDVEDARDFLNFVNISLIRAQQALAATQIAAVTFDATDAGLAQTLTGQSNTAVDNAAAINVSFPEFALAEAAVTSVSTGPANNAVLFAANFVATLDAATAQALISGLNTLITSLNLALTLCANALNSLSSSFVLGSLAYLQTNNPSVYSTIISQINTHFLTLNPSGSVAGIYARVDRERGVWKAPANVGVRSIVGPSINVTTSQQDGLNVDATSGKSINVIRSFTGKGTLVWGARTLAGNDNEWRYVNVRRLFIYAEESIQEATEFVVFEPNAATTWTRVKGMIDSFLTGLWRDGALAGATTEEAFFVRVGIGTTMTPQDVLEGRMIVEVGLAAVRPAEFIILKFMHKLQES